MFSIPKENLKVNEEKCICRFWKGPFIKGRILVTRSMNVSIKIKAVAKRSLATKACDYIQLLNRKIILFVWGVLHFIPLLNIILDLFTRIFCVVKKNSDDILD